MSAKQSAKLRVRTVPLVEDPFVNHSITDMPCWWKYGVQVLVGITLFPIRLALLLFVVAPFILICLIPFSSCFNSCCGNKKVANTEDEQPHGCCRACWVYPLRMLNRLLLWCFGFFWIAVTKKKGATPTCCNGKPAVIVANHTALMDAMFMNWFYAPMAVGKAEIKKIPVAGNAAMAFQAIFVNRKNPNSKKEVLRDIKTRTKEGTAWPPLLIFPEGTCTNGKVLVQFKRGPFTAQRPVQPLLLRYWSPYFNLCACGDNDRVGMVKSFLLMMLQPFNSLHVTLMPVYTPSTEEKNNAILFANNVRTAMAKEMNVGTTEHSYEDMFFAKYQHKKHQSVGQEFVVKDMMKAFNKSFDDITLMLDTFAKATHRGSTAMSYEEFCQFLDLKQHTAESESLWHFFDNDDSGAIEFSEFVRGVALLSNDIDDVDRLKLAFALLDHEKQGKVSIVDIRKFLADADRLEVVKGYMEKKTTRSGGDGGHKNTDMDPVAVVVVDAGEKKKEETKQLVGAGQAGEVVKDNTWQSRNRMEEPGPGLIRQSSLLDCFASVDEDGDGLVSFDEFVTLAHRRGTLAGPLLQVARDLVYPMDEVKEEEEEEEKEEEEKKVGDEQI